ncbi:TPA: A/G-specific adenine glycosylase, partial [Candidatus Poribacteria bacterium]|nr:A/G-specific adenine glycosylase [Candidatus Poribacteria bacterium]
MILDSSSTQFRKKLISWFESNQRSLPWRETNDPYHIWVSEVMLQQTQVRKVIEYYQRFLIKFPTLEQLANANLQELLKEWEGLGYYARARNLRKAAQIVVSDMGGQIPTDYNTFRKLPGVGDYTAAAVQSIAFGHSYAAVDGNVKRVIARIFMLDSPVNTTRSQGLFQEKANFLLDEDQPSTFNQAMM